MMKKNLAPLLFSLLLTTEAYSESWYSNENNGIDSNQNCCSIPYGLNPPLTYTTDCCTWVGGVEFLYWKPYQSNLIALKTATIDPVSGVTLLRTRDVRLDWDFGYRIDFGYNFPCDQFGIVATFTHFHEREREIFGQNFPSPEVSFISPGFLIGDVVIPTDHITQSNLSFITLDKLDLGFERSFYVGSRLILRPSLGLTALFLDEKFKITTTSVATGAGSIAVFNSFEADSFVRSRFKGVGPYLSLDTSWYLGCGFDLIGGATFGALFGAIKSQLNLLVSGNGITSLTPNETDFPYHLDTVKPYADFFIGFSWSQLFQDDSKLFMVKAGWEQLTLFNQGVFPQINLSQDLINGVVVTAPSDDFIISNLSFAGLFVSANISF